MSGNDIESQRPSPGVVQEQSGKSVRRGSVDRS